MICEVSSTPGLSSLWGSCYNRVMINQQVVDDITARREHQDRKFGVRDLHPMQWLTICVEEMGEVAFAICEGDNDAYRNELVDLAASAIAALECLDNGGQQMTSRLATPQVS